MLKIENVETFGWRAAIRGMRNPLNSWAKSDSVESYDADGLPTYAIGENDLNLMTHLRNAGTDHRKFMRMIVVSMDITAPLYWYKELDTYKVGTVANSCSTMHKIHAKEFTLEDFSHENLFGQRSDGSVTPYSPMENLINTISLLNEWRDIYNNGGQIDNRNGTLTIMEAHDELAWWQMIQLLPTSYNQRRTIMLNYEVLANMYKSRKNHKLDEWHVFCDWIETLPYSDLITGKDKSKSE